MNEDKDIERIEKILGQLSTLESIDPMYINEHMRKLRHYVFFVFSRVEYSLDLLFSQNANAGEKNPNSLVENISAVRDIAEVLANVPFSKKLEIYYRASIITKDMRDTFALVNNYRNWFAHPIAYEIKFKALQYNYNKQKIFLETLLNAINLLNAHFATIEAGEKTVGI